MGMKSKSDLQTTRKLSGFIADPSQHQRESENARPPKKRTFTDHVNQSPAEGNDLFNDADVVTGTRSSLFLPSSPYSVTEERRVKQKTGIPSDETREATVASSSQLSQALPKDRNAPPSIAPPSSQASTGNYSGASHATTPAFPLRRIKTLPDLRVSSAPGVLQGAASTRKSRRVKDMKLFRPTGELKSNTSTPEPKPAPAGRSRRTQRVASVDSEDQKSLKIILKRKKENISSQTRAEQPTSSQGAKAPEPSGKSQREPGTTSDGEIDYSYFVHKFLNPRRR
ncbi:hypothetical protein BDV93DRAFT_1531 [Ceratobasidium sp. AG-I]|nr:hypothetical protein BDV93DRAFT_1531 [Ceratobasidium sp. AG-I]